jgi:hypothetical protein
VRFSFCAQAHHLLTLFPLYLFIYTFFLSFCLFFFFFTVPPDSCVGCGNERYSSENFQWIQAAAFRR